MRVVCPPAAVVMDFVAPRMPSMFGEHIRYAGEYSGMGVIDDAGHLVAGVIFNDYQPTFGTIMVHLAADSPRWATRNVVRAILDFPFRQLKCQKVWGVTPNSLARVLRFNAGIGFTREAVLRNQYGKGAHAVVTSMLDSEYHKFYIDNGGIQALARHRAKMRPFVEIREAA